MAALETAEPGNPSTLAGEKIYDVPHVGSQYQEPISNGELATLQANPSLSLDDNVAGSDPRTIEQVEGGTVTYLGPIASYTHQAALSKFPSNADTNYHLRPSTTIKDVFARVKEGTAAYGVVPFENSSNGSVAFTLDLLADSQYEDILVCGETYVPVSHCLVGRAGRGPAPQPEHHHHHHQQPHHQHPDLLQRLKDEDPDAGGGGKDSHYATSSGRVTPTPAHPNGPGKPRARPLHDIRHVTKLLSHPQAWGQCKLFLDYYFKGSETEDVSSTSKAAELVARDDEGCRSSSSGVSENGEGDGVVPMTATTSTTTTMTTWAAISSRIAADVHGLDVLAEGIQDNEVNATRFLVIRRKEEVLRSMALPSATGVAAADGSADGAEDGETTKWKSLLRFTVSHDSAGALADSLAVFKRHGLNLTSIATRPSGKMPWQYIFFIEFQGRKHGGDQEGEVNAALVDLDEVAESRRWLGSWERGQ